MTKVTKIGKAIPQLKDPNETLKPFPLIQPTPGESIPA